MFKEMSLIIDPHVHFRTPGEEYKESWITGSQAALHGGVGLVFDMPNNNPSIDSLAKLEKKTALIKKQLAKSSYPLQYRLYFGAAADNRNDIRQLKGNESICGIKLYMGITTGSLLVEHDDDIKRIFEAAKDAGLVVAIHAEDNEIIKKRTALYRCKGDFCVHSEIRNMSVAASAVSRALRLAKNIGNPLYFCHVSSKNELELIRTAKSKKLPVYAEACPHHLFFTKDDYIELGSRIKMNPPVRSREDCGALWEALVDGTIDVLATDHAPHTLREKAGDVWTASSGVPGVETLLPLMLDSVNRGKISLERLSDLMHNNVVKIFSLQDLSAGKTIIDMDMEKEVKDSELKTKCGWSPYAGRRLKGWPVKVVINNREYNCLAK